MPQRVEFINKNGDPCSIVVCVIKKRSKDILVRMPEDNHEFTIPRKSVGSIKDAEKEK